METKTEQKQKRDDSKLVTKKMLERLIIIHNAIKSGLYPNNQQLRKLYCEQTGYANVGEATINRDIDTLRKNFRAPIEYDRSHNGYYYLDNWEFSVGSVSPNDAFYLSAAKNLLANFKGSPIYNEIEKVINFVTDTEGCAKSQLLNRIAIPPLPKVVVNEEIWKVVMQGLQENLILEFDYNGRWNTATTHRRVRPYQLLMEDGMHFLFCYDELANKGKGGERLFCLPRIKNIQASKEKFTLPKNYEFASRSSGGRFGAFCEQKPVKFEIDFYGPARQYVKDCVWADDQKFSEIEEDDATTISFTSSQSAKVLEWVLSQGRNARPIAPKSFVERWKEEIRGMMQNANIK